MKLSASRMYLAAACAASCALPTDTEESGEWAEAGTGRHAFLSALGATRDRAAALAVVPADAPWRPTCEAIDCDALLDGAVAIEVDLAHVYDPEYDTAAPIVVDGHRAYATDARHIPGTLDWLVTREGGWLEVVDFKGVGQVADARDNLQLALYALQVARSRDLDEIGVAIAYVHADGAVVWDRARLDVFDLAEAAARVRAVWQRVEAARAEVAAGRAVSTRLGDHCTWCPALRRCPGHIALARELAADARTVDEVVAELVRLDDDAAGVAWVRLERAEAVLEAVRKSLRARVMHRTLPLPDGRALRAVESHPRSLDAARALPVLRERLGDRVEGLVKRTLPSEVVGQVARELAPGKGVKAVEGELWAALERAGAVKTATVVSVRPMKAGKEVA